MGINTLYVLRIVCIFFSVCVATLVAIFDPFRNRNRENLNLNSSTVVNLSSFLNFSTEISFLKQKKHLILFWTPENENLEEEMSKNRLLKCPNSEFFCFSSRDPTKFSLATAIVFNMRNLNLSDLPPKRWSNQFYVFSMRESPSKIPLENFLLDKIHFFNLTMTYR